MRGSIVRRASRLQASDLILIGLVIVQLASLALFAQPLAARISQHQGAPATDRSARIAFGDRFGDFIQFVDAEVPPDGRVVIPPMDLDATFGDVGLMQYFLFPREIVNCPSGDDLPGCVRSLTGAQTHILRIGTFPAPEDVPPSKGYLPFSTDLGLYSPR